MKNVITRSVFFFLTLTILTTACNKKDTATPPVERKIALLGTFIPSRVDVNPKKMATVNFMATDNRDYKFNLDQADGDKYLSILMEALQQQKLIKVYVYREYTVTEIAAVE